MEIKAKKSRGATRKWNKKVSRKFYDYLSRQISIAASLSDDIREDVIWECVNFYIDSGNVIGKINVVEKVVFTLLKPQIDKAMLRSVRARMAAVRRSEMKRKVQESTLSEDIAVPSDLIIAKAGDESVLVDENSGESEETAGDSNVAMSRDEKRALRRQAALSRRQLKHAKRLRRRVKMPIMLHS